MPLIEIKLSKKEIAKATVLSESRCISLSELFSELISEVNADGFKKDEQKNAPAGSSSVKNPYAMTPYEAGEVMKRAGILTKSGKLSRSYRS